MNWFFIALAAPFLWAMVNVADNYLVTKFSHKEEERGSGGLVLFSSLIGLFIAFFIWIFVPHVFQVPILDKLLLSVCGVLTIVWIVFYLFALEIEETSTVVPWFLSVPIFGYILSYFFLGETFNPLQIKGSIIILIALVFMSLDFSKERGEIKHKPALYMLFASIAIAVSGVIFKYVTIENNFWLSSFWEYFSLGIAGLFIFLFIPDYRNSFLRMNKTGGRTIFIVNILSELASVSGNLLSNFALLLAPVAAVYLVGSFQPAIVLFLTILGTLFFPSIVKENLSWEILLPKFIAIILIIIGSTFFF